MSACIRWGCSVLLSEVDVGDEGVLRRLDPVAVFGDLVRAEAMKGGDGASWNVALCVLMAAIKTKRSRLRGPAPVLQIVWLALQPTNNCLPES